MYRRLLVIIWLLVLLGFDRPVGQVKADVSVVTLAEGRDFATLVLRDAWDMSQFGDISQYLNQSGQDDYLSNISVQNGVFSAAVIKDAQFSVLFPGYRTAMFTGKMGHNYPIDASRYRCLYLAMKVDTSAPDYYKVYWFRDEWLNDKEMGIWGATPGNVVPNAWYLYKVDLAASPIDEGNTTWNGSPAWQGLRIDPSVKTNVTFAVDWVRLTDCSASTTTINLGGSGTSLEVLLTPAGTSRTIRLDRVNYSLNGNTLTLDVQGLQAGDYGYTINRSGVTVNTGALTVNQTPIVTFDKPSYTSGVDYATQAGNPWDMSSPSDTTGIFDLSYSFTNGLLDMVSQPFKDPRVELNTPKPVNGSDGYRYLTYRMNTDGAYQNVPKGMIVRWIWRRAGVGWGDCYLVSHDIPFDVGWQTYSVDLYDSFNGQAEETAGNCSGLPLQWKDTPGITLFRWDPNENETAASMHQQLDWVKLTKMDQARIGQPFGLRISANKSLAGLRLTFYYTADPAQYNAHPATIITPGANPPAGKYLTYLPAILNGGSAGEPSGQLYLWDTKNVPAGTYYLCVQAADAYNTGAYCSDAPVNVVP